MTLLIADDEELIRFTVKDMIRDSDLQFDHIVEADSGAELVRLCRIHRPEIALVDIQMPGKSGLDAIQELQDAPTQWIILTGHADFAYAQKALKLGADDYLLKPPSPEELVRALRAALDRIAGYRREASGDFERRIFAVFGNTIAPEYDPLFSEPGVWSGSILCLDSSLPQKEALEIQSACARTIRKEYFPRLPAGFRGALTTLEDGKLLLTTFCVAAGVKQGEGRDEIPEPPQREGIRFCRIRIEEADNFKSYLDHLEDVKKRLPLRFFYQDILPSGCDIGNDAILDFCRRIEDLVESTGTSRNEDRDSLLDEILEMNISFSETRESMLKESLVRIFSLQETPDDYRDILIQLKKKEGGENNDGQSVLVQQAIRIVRERFNEDIGIAQIAYSLQVTPNYLSSLFRKHTGTPFTRFITELRLNRARQLLKETSQNIKEISQEVGYHSSRHFAAVFRQETGMTPTEYIKRYRS